MPDFCYLKLQATKCALGNDFAMTFFLVGV